MMKMFVSMGKYCRPSKVMFENVPSYSSALMSFFFQFTHTSQTHIARIQALTVKSARIQLKTSQHILKIHFLSRMNLYMEIKINLIVKFQIT